MRRSLVAALILLTAGTVLAGVGAAQYMGGYLEGRRVTQDWLRSQPAYPAIVDGSLPDVASPAPAQAATPASEATPAPVRPAPLGGLFALQVPKLGYLAAVREGITSSVLAGGPGHVPGTPLPGGDGNIGVSAHNVYWLRFGDIGAGDTVVLKAGGQDYTYRVSGTRIVSPDDTEALAYVPGHHLTLTTCWPLWAGALAKQRLVIRADLVGGPAAKGVA